MSDGRKGGGSSSGGGGVCVCVWGGGGGWGYFVFQASNGNRCGDIVPSESERYVLMLKRCEC